jgi:nicotinamide riboside kinase
MCKVINLYGGPGTGKSTAAAALFAELKLKGINCEYVQEYAKDKAWEFGARYDGVPKVIQAQEYIFARQHFRMRRCATEVDIIITDSPLLLGLAYIDETFPLPSLRPLVREAYDLYDNLDVFLKRIKPYEPKGRFQTENEAKNLDVVISNILKAEGLTYDTINAGKDAALEIIELMKNKWRNDIENLDK